MKGQEQQVREEVGADGGEGREPTRRTGSTRVGFPRGFPRDSGEEFDAGVVSGGRTRAVAAANQELLTTYWAVGRDILGRQDKEGWGAKVIDRLSADLKNQFPEAKGFSPRNLKYMRALAEMWPEAATVQAPLAPLPWYHQIALIEKLHDAGTRLWYAAAAVENGWSRNVLVHLIDTRLRERSGRAISNFAATLPPSDSDLAQQATRDPYVFDFVAMTERRNERELEAHLVKHVQKFLLCSTTSSSVAS